MGSLTRRQQLASIVEAIPGTVNTGAYAAAQAKHQIIDASMDFDFPPYARDVKRNTLTPVPSLSGAQQAKCSFSLELIGESSGGVPTWDEFIRACGMRRETLYKITIGAVTSGPFRHGETITQGTTACTAKVFMDTYTGTTTLYVYDVRGTTDNSHVWTGGTTGATATASTTASAAGYGYAPVDVPTLLVTVTGTSGAVATGDIATGGTTGAIGSVEGTARYLLTCTGTAGGTVAVGDVVTGGTSSAVAVVDVINSQSSFLVRLRGSTLFTAAEALTFAGSGSGMPTRPRATRASIAFRKRCASPRVSW